MERSAGGDVMRWRANLQREVDGATLYRAMATGEPDAKLASIYQRLADTEAGHAALWEGRLRQTGAWRGRPSESWRTRILVLLARRLGAGIVSPTVAAHEARDQRIYDLQPEAAGTPLAREERSHARVLAAMSGGLAGPAIARLEGRHRAVGGNALRAAVLGVDDGLVSSFGLVMGVVGAGGDPRAIVVAGLAGALAGSLSMALGEWLSVQSARELHERQLTIERDELMTAPAEEEDELALIYEAKGVDAAQARTLAARIVGGDPRVALDVLAREELGIDPRELGGSAYVAAATSFAMFAVGALVPLAPFVLLSGASAVVAAAIVSAAALFTVGALITVLTGQPALRAGARQVAIGVAAAAVTFGIGRLVGIAIG